MGTPHVYSSQSVDYR